MTVLLLILTTLLSGQTFNMENTQVITKADILQLPEPVQRSLEYSKVIGTPRIKSVMLKQTGLFKTAPDRPWVPFSAVQTFDIETASFEWKVKMKMAPLMYVFGRDRLQDGRGSVKIKLMGLFPLVNEEGPEMDQGAMTRYLSETIWFPQAWLDDHIRWEEVDSTSARAILTIGEKSVEGIFAFDDVGRVVEFSCQRYASEADDMILRPWRTPVTEYGELAGLQLGIKGQALWERPEGDYTYVDLEITELSYK